MGAGKVLFTIYYILIQGVGSGIIAGGVQFAIAYGIYHSSLNPVHLWGFPNTLSGDCALSLFIQTGASWVAQEIVTGQDVYRKNNDLCAIPKFFSRHKPDKVKNKWIYLFFEVDRGVIKGGDKATIKGFLRQQFIQYPNRRVITNLIFWLANKVIRGLIWSIPVFCTVWPVTMGVLAAIGHKYSSDDYLFNIYPAPAIIKLVFGCVLGFAVSPFATIVILLRNYWYIQELEEQGLHPQEMSVMDLEKNAHGDMLSEDGQALATPIPEQPSETGVPYASEQQAQDQVSHSISLVESESDSERDSEQNLHEKQHGATSN